MADLPTVQYGLSHPIGVRPNEKLPVITGSPQHHMALMQLGDKHRQVRDLVAAFGGDLQLNIQRVPRPKGA